jgi:hypothetical protein
MVNRFAPPSASALGRPVRRLVVALALASLVVGPTASGLVSTFPATADDSDPTGGMVEEGALVLEPGEDRPQTALMAPDGSHAYFVSSSRGSTCPSAPTYCDSVIVKVRMSDFTRVGSLALSGYGGRQSFTGAIAPSGEFGYFGVDGDNSNNAHIVKVKLDDMTKVDAIALSSEKFPRVTLMAPDGTFAHFVSTGANTSNPGRIARVELEPQFRRISGATLPGNRFGTNPQAGAITADGSLGYVGAFELTTSRGAQLLEVDLDGGISFPTGRILALEGLGTNLTAFVIDSDEDQTFLYVGTNSRRFVKIRRSDLSIVGQFTFTSAIGGAASAVMDPDGLHAYVGTTSGNVLKILLRGGDEATGDMRVVGTIRAEDGTTFSSQSNYSAAISPDGEYAVFGRFTDPGRTVRVRLRQATPEEPPTPESNDDDASDGPVEGSGEEDDAGGSDDSDGANGTPDEDGPGAGDDGDGGDGDGAGGDGGSGDDANGAPTTGGSDADGTGGTDGTDGDEVPQGVRDAEVLGPSLGPTDGIILRNGRIEQIVATIDPSVGSGGAMVLQADGITITLAGDGGVTSGSGIVAGPDGEVACRICAGLVDDSVIEAWLYSTPRLASAVRIVRSAVDQPCVLLSVPVGAPLDGAGSIEPGTHTLQLRIPTEDGLTVVAARVTVGADGSATNALGGPPVPTRVPTGGGPTPPGLMLLSALLASVVGLVILLGLAGPTLSVIEAAGTRSSAPQWSALQYAPEHRPEHAPAFTPTHTLAGFDALEQRLATFRREQLRAQH